MPHLSLTYVPEDSWGGEVTASVESAYYAGRGSACFGLEQLRKFCAELEAFPISVDAPPTLIGGFWYNTSDEIDQTHVGIMIAPYDRFRGLVVSVRLSTPIWNSQRPDLFHSVVTHFRTDYPSLEKFRTSLLALVAAQTHEARLDGQ